ncbi:hypothetical protein ANN_09038 [Periplaneta americana]|uniref:DUF4817 domain-containing protein n=1 Tax=Periplaneta americana TaxID=6978 RepID=A0ABQ8TMD7_PERAM|nr:hypothetical protein ANN_09038 [Periplaneta americana]
MYSNQELAEIHFMYGKADGNAALALRLYQERYPQRQCPDRKTFLLFCFIVLGCVSMQQLLVSCNESQFHEWIGRYCTTEWRRRSCDVTPCDFSLWGILKNYVFAQKPRDLHQLRQMVDKLYVKIDENLVTELVVDFDNVEENFHRVLMDIVVDYDDVYGKF